MQHVNYIKFEFNKIHPNKISFSFTWDDNFERHIDWIAPIFNKYQKKCTFYINPGNHDFYESLKDGYSQLAKQEFEIGSHGYTHHHFSRLSDADFKFQLTESKEKITEITNIIPITFAFPHHDYSLRMLETAKEIYLETRNTLNNTPRYSLKSHTTIVDIQNTVLNAISNRHSLVFSGHSVSLSTDINGTLEGFEPISSTLLDEILHLLTEYQHTSEICTFSQAVLKEFIYQNCEYTNKMFYMSRDQLLYLKKYGLSRKRIEELI